MKRTFLLIVLMVLTPHLPSNASEKFIVDESIAFMSNLYMEIYLFGKEGTIRIIVPYPDRKSIRDKKNTRRAKYTIEEDDVNAWYYDGGDVSKYMTNIGILLPPHRKPWKANSGQIIVDNIPTDAEIGIMNWIIAVEISSINLSSKGLYTFGKTEIKASIPLP